MTMATMIPTVHVAEDASSSMITQPDLPTLTSIGCPIIFGTITSHEWILKSSGLTQMLLMLVASGEMVALVVLVLLARSAAAKATFSPS